MHRTDHTIPPQEALEKGRYLWAPRKERSDKMDERVMGLARRFWHSDDISRASGDSGTKAMWRPSKKAGEEYHPRRQLMVAGDQVWHKFLKWPEYLGLKAELLREDSSFTDPGRTLFLSTRCGCLVEPKISPCACQIHTQQGLYLKVEMLMPAMHSNCDCTCKRCDGGSGCGKWMAMCKDLHSFSEALACEKVDFLEEDRGGKFEHWGRKPACVAMECSECGFGNPGGIPMNCDALGSMADRVVGWLRFEDQVMEDGKVHKKQQIPQAGKLDDLWKEFVEHSKKYIHHHELAKWQRQAHNMCLATFGKGELLVETDFIEKYKHEAGAVLTCATAPSTTMMVALVHHSPDDDGRHETDAWVFVSSDPNHDFDFHIYAMDIILRYYITGDGRAATAGTPVPTVHIFTDGCAKQYKGKHNFYAVAKSLHRLGVVLIHNFAVTSHFKGAHDGIGGLLKALLREAEKRGQRIHNTQAAADFLQVYAEAKEDGGGHFSSWSPYRIKRFHIKLLGHREIPRPFVDLTGISGSSKLYQFMGAEVQEEESSGVGVEVQTENGVPLVGGEKEVVANPQRWQADESTVLTLPTVTKRYKLRVRQASCYCSCSVGAYDDCVPAKK
ncbi:unnamed protein product [Ectocarpus sp. CCAP 1310/34]|nr:unnamed protein product [Ectocarpus sp. CCAP 1310/34]